MARDLTILAAALLVATAVAFTRQRRMVMTVCGALFVAVATAATLALYGPASPTFTAALLAATMGLPLLTLALYAVDLLLSPFCAQMSYPAMLCWVLWPVLVAADLVGLVLV